MMAQLEHGHCTARNTVLAAPPAMVKDKSGEGGQIAVGPDPINEGVQPDVHLSWARVRRVRQGSLSAELLMCGGGVRSILLLPLVARYLETIGVCIWRMFVFMSVVVTVGVCGNVCCVAAIVKNSVFFALEW